MQRAWLFRKWPKLVSNPFLYRSIMNLFDEPILTVLNDGKPRIFAFHLFEYNFTCSMVFVKKDLGSYLPREDLL